MYYLNEIAEFVFTSKAFDKRFSFFNQFTVEIVEKLENKFIEKFL